MSDQTIHLRSRDFWVKVVAMLQQNWALIEEESDGVTVYFLDDNGGVFDEMPFPTSEEAARALVRNGFGRYADDVTAQKYISPPEPPFTARHHPNGQIYSSGRFWS